MAFLFYSNFPVKHTLIQNLSCCRTKKGLWMTVYMGFAVGYKCGLRISSGVYILLDWCYHKK